MRVVVGVVGIGEDGSCNVDNIVDVVGLENLVPNALASVVVNEDKVKFAIPFGMQVQELLSLAGRTDRADNGVAGLDCFLDDMGGHEAIGAGDEDVRHLGVISGGEMWYT